MNVFNCIILFSFTVSKLGYQLEEKEEQVAEIKQEVENGKQEKRMDKEEKVLEQDLSKLDNVSEIEIKKPKSRKWGGFSFS